MGGGIPQTEREKLVRAMNIFLGGIVFDPIAVAQGAKVVAPLARGVARGAVAREAPFVPLRQPTPAGRPAVVSQGAARTPITPRHHDLKTPPAVRSYRERNLLRALSGEGGAALTPKASRSPARATQSRAPS